MKRIIGLVLLTLATLTSLVGQEITGTIRGQVRDTSGAVINSATVSVTNTDRGQVVRTVHSNQGGDYVAPLLPVGHYEVSVEAPGFKKYVKSEIVVNVSDNLTEDAVLQLGTATDTVTVEAEPIQVNQESSVAEGLIEGSQVRELPLANRNYEQLVTLQPGVTSNAADQLYVGTTDPSGHVNVVSFSVNGQRQSENNWTIDGSDNLDHGSNITLLVYPSVDAISEFKIERSNYGPEFGRSSAGQINVVTRSGTQKFHGSVYEFFRNDVLNANSPINKLSTVWHPTTLPRPILRYNDFGGTFGGPVYIPGVYNQRKDKTFFFFSEEIRRVTTPVTETSSGAPTPALLAGNFTGVVCTSIDSSGNCLTTGTSISPASFNPLAAAYIKDIYSKIALPTTSNNLTSVQPGVFNYREELYRLDHVLTSKVALMGRFINDHIPTQEPFGLFGPQASLPGVGNTKTDSPGQQWMGRVTAQFTERIFNEVGYAYSYGAIISDPTGLITRTKSPDVAAAVNLPYSVTLNRIPALVFDDGDTQGGFGQYRDYNRNHNVFDNLSWNLGKHSTRFGLSYNRYQKQENAAGNNAGTYEFDATNADPSNPNSFEQDWANFLLGYTSSSFSQSNVDFTANVHQSLWEFYGQDSWRMFPNLTVTYGLRYSYFQTPYGDGKNLVSFDQNIYNLANAPAVDASGNLSSPAPSNPGNGYIVGGVNSPYGQFITKQDKTDFAPRLGIAWDPFKTGKTSVRAGYGIFYDSIAAGLIEDNVFNNTSDAQLGFNMSAPNIAAAGLLPPSIYGTDPNWKTPYTESYNLDFQNELGKGLIFDIGYSGSKSKHLPGVIDINQVKPGVAAAAGLLTGSNVMPGTNILKGSTSVARKLNAYRPYVGFTQIGEISPIFSSNYNSLQTSLNKHFGQTTTVGVFYTWSKALTDNQSDRSTGTMYTYCIKCDYGRATLDRRHVFTADFVFDTPWFRDQSKFSGQLLGGWEATGILSVDSGLPFTVFGNSTLEGDPLASGYRGDGSGYGRVASIRPMQIGDPNTGPRNYNQWFNTAAFSVATISGVVPTEHRGSVDGPGLWRYDMSMTKNIHIYESLNGQFRVEAFNLFNHNNPSSIGTTYSTSPTSSFGRVTNSRDGRTLQLALKLIF